MCFQLGFFSPTHITDGPVSDDVANLQKSIREKRFCDWPKKELTIWKGNDGRSKVSVVLDDTKRICEI